MVYEKWFPSANEIILIFFLAFFSICFVPCGNDVDRMQQ